ncbi:hypothetical protein AHF37_07592 [Paragonimus kellicotti]|nr:hypothetical protein AHF37_07592 [Paragonimus kellicotti]
MKLLSPYQKQPPHTITRLTVRPSPNASLVDQPGYQSTPFTQAKYPLSSCIRKGWSPGNRLFTHLPNSRGKVDQVEYLKTQQPEPSNEQPLLDVMMEQEQSELVARLLRKTEVASPDETKKDCVKEKSDLHRNLGATVTENTESISHTTQCSLTHVQYSACQKHISEGVSLECSKGDDQTDIQEQDEEVKNKGIPKADSIQIAMQTKNYEIKPHEASRTIRCSPPNKQMSNTVIQLDSRYSPHPGSPSFKPAHTYNRSEIGAVPVPKCLQNGRVAAVVKRLEQLSSLQLTVPKGNPMQPPQNEISKTTSYFTGCSGSLDRLGSTKRLDHRHNKQVKPDKCCDDPQTANVASIIHQQTEVYSQLPSFESSKICSRPRTDSQANSGKVGDIKLMAAASEHSEFLSTSQLKSQNEASLAVPETTTPYPITRLTVRPSPNASLVDQPGYQSTPFTQAKYPLSSCIRKGWSPGNRLFTHLPNSRGKVDQVEYLKTQQPEPSNEQPLLDVMMEQEQSELVARLLRKTEVASPDETKKDCVKEKSDLHRNLGATVTENTESISHTTQCSLTHGE